MTSISDTVYETLSQSPSPLSTKTIAHKTKIGKKFVRAVMNQQERSGNIVRVKPYLYGSGKSRGSVFCTKENVRYA